MNDQKPMPPVQAPPTKVSRIAISLTREQLAVAILAYVERTQNCILSSEDIDYTAVCFSDDKGEIERVDAAYMPKKKTIIELS